MLVYAFDFRQHALVVEVRFGNEGNVKLRGDDVVARMCTPSGDIAENTSTLLSALAYFTLLFLCFFPPLRLGRLRWRLLVCIGLLP